MLAAWGQARVRGYILHEHMYGTVRCGTVQTHMNVGYTCALSTQPPTAPTPPHLHTAATHLQVEGVGQPHEGAAGGGGGHPHSAVGGVGLARVLRATGMGGAGCNYQPQLKQTKPTKRSIGGG